MCKRCVKPAGSFCESLRQFLARRIRDVQCNMRLKRERRRDEIRKLLARQKSEGLSIRAIAARGRRALLGRRPERQRRGPRDPRCPQDSWKSARASGTLLMNPSAQRTLRDSRSIFQTDIDFALMPASARTSFVESSVLSIRDAIVSRDITAGRHLPSRHAQSVRGVDRATLTSFRNSSSFAIPGSSRGLRR